MESSVSVHVSVVVPIVITDPPLKGAVELFVGMFEEPVGPNGVTEGVVGLVILLDLLGVGAVGYGVEEEFKPGRVDTPVPDGLGIVEKFDGTIVGP